MNDAKFLTHWCDLVVDHPPFDFDDAFKKCSASDFKGLPGKLALRVEPDIPYTMQLFSLDQARAPADPKLYTVLKVISGYPNRFTLAQINAMAASGAHQISWGKDYRDGWLAFNYMLLRLGGYSIRWHIITARNQPKGHPNQTARKAGYQFIKDKGPRTSGENQEEE